MESPNLQQQIEQEFKSLFNLANEIGVNPSVLLSRGAAIALLVEFKTRALTLASFLDLDGRVPVKEVEYEISEPYIDSMAQRLSGFLHGLYRAHRAGLLSDIEQRIEAALSVDYLDQASRLVNEDEDVSFSYIPAAVLAGAVLEKNLRTLCEKHTPPIPTMKSSGKRLTMTALIDELKKEKVLNEVWAKQLRTWAGVRNAAAHGHHEEISRDQVASMIRDIPSFLSIFMG